MQEKVLILDFGSQYTQLIARRVRELNIYCEIFPFNNNKYKISDYKALILSGSPYSVRSEDSLKINIDNIRGVLPILGICYGAQLLAHNSGGVVKASKTREYGRANLQSIDNTNNLFSNIQNSSQVWMSHADTIFKLPPSTKRIASTKDVENAAFQFIDENTFGIQFHPEVYHSSDGKTLLKNFLVDIANINPNWTASSFVDKTIHELKNIIGDESVVLGLSGGVDSSVAAVLLNKAIGNNLYCVFIDNGLLRKNEFDSVLKQYEGMGLNVKGVDAKDKFYSALKNIDDPEKKRKVIGKALQHFLAKAPISITVNGREFLTGDANYSIGQVIRIVFLDNTQELGENRPIIDTKKSGDYIICGAKHVIKYERFDTVLLCGKLASFGDEVTF